MVTVQGPQVSWKGAKSAFSLAHTKSNATQHSKMHCNAFKG